MRHATPNGSNVSSLTQIIGSIRPKFYNHTNISAEFRGLIACGGRMILESERNLQSGVERAIGSGLASDKIF